MNQIAEDYLFFLEFESFPPIKKKRKRQVVVEYDDEKDMIDYCMDYDCPKKKLVCLQLLKKLNGDNPQYQNIINRFENDITGNYEPSGEM
jgi:hypothetical protein